jgi:hypothetical protein
MATDRDEQSRQKRELEEIRRSFAEMGARMGSLFEPAEAEPADAEAAQAQRQLPAPPPAASLPLAFQGRPRWWWAAALVVLFVAGTLFGWILPNGEGSPEAAPAPPQTTTATTAAPTTTAAPRTVVSVPEECVDAAELADEIISKLNRNQRDNALALALRDWSVANQACRREAQP